MEILDKVSEILPKNEWYSTLELSRKDRIIYSYKILAKLIKTGHFDSVNDPHLPQSAYFIYNIALPGQVS